MARRRSAFTTALSFVVLAACTPPERGSIPPELIPPGFTADECIMTQASATDPVGYFNMTFMIHSQQSGMQGGATLSLQCLSSAMWLF
jgi:hypothetical protein